VIGDGLFDEFICFSFWVCLLLVEDTSPVLRSLRFIWLHESKLDFGIVVDTFICLPLFSMDRTIPTSLFKTFVSSKPTQVPTKWIYTLLNEFDDNVTLEK
jgi:hypothetical protein